MHGSIFSYSKLVTSKSMYVIPGTDIAAKAKKDEAGFHGTIATRVNGNGSLEERVMKPHQIPTLRQSV